jgi:hypothetical protein
MKDATTISKTGIGPWFEHPDTFHIIYACDHITLIISEIFFHIGGVMGRGTIE